MCHIVEFQEHKFKSSSTLYLSTAKFKRSSMLPPQCLYFPRRRHYMHLVPCTTHRYKRAYITEPEFHLLIF